jgi:hypothetical protein
LTSSGTVTSSRSPVYRVVVLLRINDHCTCVCTHGEFVSTRRMFTVNKGYICAVGKCVPLHTHESSRTAFWENGGGLRQLVASLQTSQCELYITRESSRFLPMFRIASQHESRRMKKTSSSVDDGCKPLLSVTYHNYYKWYEVSY